MKEFIITNNYQRNVVCINDIMLAITKEFFLLLQQIQS
jgi:hypothetical protein